MGRERKPLKRPRGKRKANLFIIATEGQKTEPIYFNDLVDYYPNSKVHVEILDKLKESSSPQAVIRQLNKFKAAYLLDKEDELWMVIDRDAQSWTIETIREIAQKCHQKGYYLALSNPCFELWLLLHLKNLKNYTNNELEAFLTNKKVTKNRTSLEQELLNVLGAYNKSNLATKHFLPHVRIAIKSAKLLDTNLMERWPSQLGTRVYQLVEKILPKQS